MMLLSKRESRNKRQPGTGAEGLGFRLVGLDACAWGEGVAETDTGAH